VLGVYVTSTVDGGESWPERGTNLELWSEQVWWARMTRNECFVCVLDLIRIPLVGQVGFVFHPFL
jgi:hypothetical protein